MTRGTFGNIRLRNNIVPGVEGGTTTHFPDRVRMSIYDAAMRYKEEGVPLLVIAGSEYGTGSSRDWAAKGTLLLGVKAVIAKSYERIHRSNLVGMGVLPLEFLPGEDAETLNISGGEMFNILGLHDDIKPGDSVRIQVYDGDKKSEFDALIRIDTDQEVEYYRNGGILPTVLRQMMNGS